MKWVSDGNYHVEFVNILEELTGWTRLDPNLTLVREQLETAQSEEQCQVVGLLVP